MGRPGLRRLYEFGMSDDQPPAGDDDPRHSPIANGITLVLAVGIVCMKLRFDCETKAKTID